MAGEENNIRCCGLEFWVFVILSLALVAIAGITSGLALGLLSFSKVDLEVLVKAGRAHERKYAAKILPLVKNEHLLLCTLLVVKSVAMEALPIFLEPILPPWAAILVSVTLLLAFAEIVPQAVCSRYGLSLGAKMSVFVHCLLFALFPIAYPISKTLDCLLGKGHAALYRRAELKTLVDLHADEAGKGGDLSHHETSIISGALDLTDKTAGNAMTPISEIFSLDINSKLDMHTMSLIMNKGHSRVPVYSSKPSNIIGLILVKNLIFYRPEDETPIKNMTIRNIPRVYEDWPLYNILNMFLNGHSHMAVVVKSTEKPKDVPRMFQRTPSVSKLNESLDPKKTPNYMGSDIYELMMKQQQQSSSDTTTVLPCYSSDSETPMPVLSDSPPDLQSIYPGNDIVAHKDFESSLPSCSSDHEEIIGIITMEDLVEELLQKEILDETDKYVDVHDKIRINLPYSRRSRSSSPRSPLKSSSPSYRSGSLYNNYSS